MNIMQGNDVNHTIAEHLTKLQQGEPGRYVVFHPVPCGLGGQITGRIQTLALALALNRKAIFLALEDLPYSQSFNPMHEASPAQIDWAGAEPADLASDQGAVCVCYDPMKMSLHSEAMDALFLTRIGQNTGAHIAGRMMLEGMIFNWMQPTPAMRSFCDAARKRLGVDRETLGIHFRRGDKAVETAFVPASEFNRQIKTLYESWKFTSVFLASDSPHAKAEIILPPGVRLIFDDQEQRYNNANHKMLANSPELALQETQVAYKNIALLAACGGVIGQDNAHFATLSASSIVARDNRMDRVVLIDGRFSEKKSPLIAGYFRFKMATRRIARILFPHLTMAARMKRKKP